mgnify:CR=1 FL=1
MGQNVTNLAGAAMTVYDKNVYEQTFEKNVLMQNLRKDLGVTSADGTSKTLTVHYGRNIGTAAGSETITLPTAGNQKFKQATVAMKYNFGQLSLTDVVLEASKSNLAYLVNALDAEYEGAKNDMARQIQRQWYGLGDGSLGLVNGAATGTDTVVLDTPAVGKYVGDYVEDGQILRFGATATDIATVDYYIGQHATVSNQDSIALVTGHGATIDDNDNVYIARSATESNKDAEMSGLKLLIDDGTNATACQSLNRVTTPPYYTWWRSYVNDASAARSLTETLMQTTYLQAKKFGMPKIALTSYDLYQKYALSLTPDRRYTSSDMDVKGGFTGVKFNDMVLLPDFDCPFDEMYFIDTNALSVEELTPVSFMEKDGAILSRSATTPAYQATLRYYANLAVNKPRSCSALRDVI